LAVFGEILGTLERLNLDENTLVIYAADQGWMGGQNGLWGMGDHTRPIGAHELMMQIPLIFRQPGRIASGLTNDHLFSNYDFLPTVLGHLGLSNQRPGSPELPGRDISPALVGRDHAWDDVVYYEMETCRAIRTDRWKYVARFPDGPFELYDMTNDPHERFNLIGQPETDATRAELAERLNAFFARYADPQYDLWKGGRSKAKRLTAASQH
jgi:arylsulfatase A-like enzyme